jgi:hypothetical protein
LTGATADHGRLFLLCKRRFVDEGQVQSFHRQRPARKYTVHTVRMTLTTPAAAAAEKIKMENGEQTNKQTNKEYS